MAVIEEGFSRLHSGGFHLSDADRVITAIVGVDQSALEHREGIVKDWKAMDACPVRNPGELVPFRGREATRERLLIPRQDVDREPSRVNQGIVTVGVPIHAHKDPRGLDGRRR